MKTLQFKITCISLLSSVVLLSCSSDKKLPMAVMLQTTAESQNYSYCSSCPKPTELKRQEYKPLEPDTPLIVAKPIVEPITIVNHTKRKMTTHKKINHHIIKHKQVSKSKQCIQWSK